MSIVAGELILYGAASRAEDETSTSGGDIDLTARPFDSDTVSSSNVQAVSSNAGDTTQDITVRYRDAAGVLQTATETLTGTTPVVFNPAIAAERLIEATLSGTTAGSVTLAIEGGATQHTFAPGELKAFRCFINTVSGAAEKNYYEKLCFKNTNATLALQAAKVDCTADPSAVIAIALEEAQKATTSVADRYNVVPTPLTGAGWVSDTTQLTVPGTGANIAAGDWIGVWVRLTLAANNVAIKDTFTLRLSGQTV